MGTAPDQPPKSEQDGVWTIPTPQPAGPAEVRGRAAVSQALPEKLVEFGHASVVGLVAGQQVSEVTATGDSAATNPWEFASVEERQFVSVMRSVDPWVHRCDRKCANPVNTHPRASRNPRSRCCPRCSATHTTCRFGPCASLPSWAHC